MVPSGYLISSVYQGLGKDLFFLQFFVCLDLYSFKTGEIFFWRGLGVLFLFPEFR